MSNHLGDANKMVSDTPRTDEAYFKKGATMYDLAGEMKRMERELNAANERIKRLEEAGDSLKAAGYFGGFGDAVNKWNKAKEAKP
jgi:predicted  nucleic acid-binding Zn-ribbon protein